MSLILKEPLPLEKVFAPLLCTLLLHVLHGVLVLLLKLIFASLISEYLLVKVTWVLVRVGRRAVIFIAATRAGAATIPGWRPTVRKWNPIDVIAHVR